MFGCLAVTGSIWTAAFLEPDCDKVFCLNKGNLSRRAPNPRKRRCRYKNNNISLNMNTVHEVECFYVSAACVRLIKIELHHAVTEV